jgi:hypothetical protein
VIAAVLRDQVHPIEGLYFDAINSVESPQDAPDGAPAYVALDEKTGEGTVVAWYEATTKNVIEAATRYPLNVRGGPGTSIEQGPQGEELYVYGFAWYPRWSRILPEPVISLLEGFYTEGIDHVRSALTQYGAVAHPDYFGGDLGRVTWDEELLSVIAAWGTEFPGAPFMALPDSGTVDIRDEQFAKAIEDGLVAIDETTVADYAASDFPKRTRYSTFQSSEAVIQNLLFPFHSPGNYSELQKFIILGSLFDGRGPLTLSIDMQLDGGFFVPDSGLKTIQIAPSEVDIMFGFEGPYVAKLPHEFSHLLEFRDYNFITERCLPNEDDVVETLKYVLDYMWWVQQYSGNAPYWDWEPINSGLVLANLLAATYANFDCG